MAAQEIPVTGHLTGSNAQEIRGLRLWQKTTTPTTPTDGLFWYNSNGGDKRIYFYDSVLGAEVKVPRLDRSETVTGQYSFSPTSVQAPFLVGANGDQQKVVGLNADYLDDYHAATAATAWTIPIRDANGNILLGDPTLGGHAVTLDYLTTALTTAEFSADQITSGILSLERGGTGSSKSASSATYQVPMVGLGGFVYSTVPPSGGVMVHGGLGIDYQSELDIDKGGTNASTAAGARTNLDVPWNDDLHSMLQHRRALGGIQFDASASFRVTGLPGNNIGLQDFTIQVAFQATLQIVCVLWASHGVLGNNHVRLNLTSAGVFQLVFVDGAGAATTYNLTPDSAIVTGQFYVVTVTCDRDGNATLYVNGTSDRDLNGTGITTSIAASSAVDIGSGNANGWGLGYTFHGSIYNTVLWNRALTSTEVLQAVRRGGPSSGDQWGEFTTSYTSDFSAGVESWVTDSGRSVVGNVDGIDGQNDWMKVEVTTGPASLHTYRNYAGVAQRIHHRGAYVKVSFRVHNPVGSTITYISAGFTGTNSMSTGNLGVPTAVAAGSTVDVSVIIGPCPNSGAYVMICSTTSTGNANSLALGQKFYLKNVVLQRLGCVMDVDLENADPVKTTMVRDRSGYSTGTIVSPLTMTSTKKVSQFNTDYLLASSLTANNIVYAGTGGLLTGLTNNSGSIKYLTQTTSGTPTWTDLYGEDINWSGVHVFSDNVSGITPTSSLHFATKGYVDSAAAGLRALAPVATATTANITLSGEQTIDGILTSASRVLVKNQTAPAENGVYVSAAGAWTRATDCNTAAEITRGAYVFVQAGTTQAGYSYQQTETVATLGTDSVTWNVFFQQISYTGGNGIDVTGTTISVDATDSFAWTGAHTFASSSGLVLLPHTTTAGATTALHFRELAANGSHYVAFKAADSIAANVTWTLPSADGSANYYLKTNGSGTLSFAAIASTEITNTTFAETISGTADRITIGGTVTSPSIDIASTYVGQTSITTLGTIATGTWNATTIATTKGGTGLTSYTTGDTLYASAANTLSKLAIGSAGKILRSSGTIPAWSTLTIVDTITTNALLYASASNTVTALTSTANRVLTTDSSGVPGWTATLPTGLTFVGDSSAYLPKIKWFNVGDGATTSITLTHNFGTRDVVVQAYEAGSEYKTPLLAVGRTTTNTLTLEFVTAPTSNQYRVAVICQG
jgi:hypothetical protein